MRCPECGTNGYSRKTKTPEWRCRKCGHEWEQSDLALEPNSRTNPRPSARRTKRSRSRASSFQDSAPLRLSGSSPSEIPSTSQSQSLAERRRDLSERIYETLRASIGKHEERIKEGERILERKLQEKYKPTENSPIGESQSPRRSYREPGDGSALVWFGNWLLGPLVIIGIIVGLVFLLGVCSETPRHCETNPSSCDDRNFGDPRLH